MELYKTNQLKLYNSLSKSKELFVPIVEGNVGMYVCGPTVYSNVHLGNVRTFMSFDLIFRYLKHLGYKVRYVRNITDVDDNYSIVHAEGRGQLTVEAATLIVTTTALGSFSKIANS